MARQFKHNERMVPYFTEQAKEEKRMKIMSFNTQHCLNYVSRSIDFQVMADAILRLDPDIVGLNEMRGEGPHPDYTAQVERLAQLTGMKYFYFAPAIELPQGLYGNGILSKYPIGEAQTITIPDPVEKVAGGRYETRCILRAEIEGVTVLVTHMGLMEDEQKNAVRAVLEQVSETRCVLMGDFNMQPNDPILSPVFEKMTDTAGQFCANSPTFPSDAPEIKIDYIFASRDVRVLHAEIPAIVASDHRPHFATVEF